MKLAVIGFSMAVLFCHGVTSACSIQDVQKVQIGDYKGIKGRCSNKWAADILCIHRRQRNNV